MLIAVMAVTASLAVAAPASALTSHFVPLGSYSDARGDLPVRSGTLVEAHYGPFTVPANGQIHNQIDSVLAPCNNCYVTDIVPSLVYDSGGAAGTTVANLDTGAMMHHFLIANPGPGKQDSTCPGTGPGLLGERFFASGNERTHMHLPNGFGYQQGTNTNWNLVTHLVNRTAASKTYWLDIVFRYVPVADPVRPIWLDIDGMTPSCGDSEYTIPTGYSDTHQTWTVPAGTNGRLVSISGHMHDVDITGPGSCVNHCPAEGLGIAVSAELVGGSASEYYGPNPPTRNGTPTSPPADLTGATLCRSEGYYGTPFGASQWAGHLDTVNVCGIFSNVPGGAQALMYPSSAQWPAADGYKITAGQQIKLHTEYQNDTGSSQIDAMGIMVGWLSPTEPGYPRPKAATPFYAPLVNAYNACGSTNRAHGGGLSYPSCNPPTLSSTQATAGTPDANSAGANFVGSVKFVVINGYVATTADEADVNVNVNITDVRKASDLSDYTGQLELRPNVEITDRNNGPAEVREGQPYDLSIPVACAPTPGASPNAVGSTCSVSTSIDAVFPSAGNVAVRENRRSNWEIGQVKVYDGGPDGQANTIAGNTLFAVQGVFVP